MKKNFIFTALSLLGLLGVVTFTTYMYIAKNYSNDTFYQGLTAILVLDSIATAWIFLGLKDVYDAYRRHRDNQIIHEELRKHAMDELEEYNIRVIEVSSDDTIESLFEKIRSSSNMDDRATKTSGLPNTIIDCKNALKRAKTQSEVDALLERLQELRNK